MCEPIADLMATPCLLRYIYTHPFGVHKVEANQTKLHTHTLCVYMKIRPRVLSDLLAPHTTYYILYYDRRVANKNQKELF